VVKFGCLSLKALLEQVLVSKIIMAVFNMLCRVGTSSTQMTKNLPFEQDVAKRELMAQDDFTSTKAFFP
jgi:hypothetical protein